MSAADELPIASSAAFKSFLLLVPLLHERRAAVQQILCKEGYKLIRDFLCPASGRMGKVTPVVGWIAWVTITDISLALTQLVVLTLAPDQLVKIPWCLTAGPEIRPPVKPGSMVVVHLTRVQIRC